LTKSLISILKKQKAVKLLSDVCYLAYEVKAGPTWLYR